MDNEYKIVDFEKYCKLCKHEKLSESEDPCWDCLNEPVNTQSQKPVYWEDKENG